MTDLSRRGLLGGAALGLAATALGACATRPEAAPAAARSLGMAAPVPPNPALRPDLEVRTIGCGSCFNQGRSGETLEAAIRARPDLFLFMGDNVYGDVTSPEMNELLSAYAGALARPDYRRFREAMPHLAVWDDHDYGDNDAGVTFAYRQATRPLFLDFWDVPADSPRRTRDGVWDAVTVGPQGRRTQFILLDTRTWRDDWTPTDERDAPGKERYVPNPDPAKTILGRRNGPGSARPCWSPPTCASSSPPTNWSPTAMDGSAGASSPPNAPASTISFAGPRRATCSSCRATAISRRSTARTGPCPGPCTSSRPPR